MIWNKILQNCLKKNCSEIVKERRKEIFDFGFVSEVISSAI